MLHRHVAHHENFKIVPKRKHPSVQRWVFQLQEHLGDPVQRGPQRTRERNKPEPSVEDVPLPALQLSASLVSSLLGRSFSMPSLSETTTS